MADVAFSLSVCIFGSKTQYVLTLGSGVDVAYDSLLTDPWSNAQWTLANGMNTQLIRA